VCSVPSGPAPGGDDKRFNHPLRSPGMERTRRGVLTVAVPTLAAFAGCGSGVDPQGTTDGDDGGADTRTETPTPTPDPAPNLAFDGFELLQPAESLVVTVTVVNDGDETGTATLELYVRVGDEETTRERRVSLDPGEEETYRFEFESFTREGVFADGSVDPRFRPADDGE